MNKESFERLKVKGLMTGTFLEHQRRVRERNKTAREAGYAGGIDQAERESRRK